MLIASDCGWVTYDDGTGDGGINTGDDGSSGGGGSSSNDGNDNTEENIDLNDGHGLDAVPAVEEEQIDETPCQKIATQIANQDFINNREVLRDSTGIKHEIGFSQSGEGTFNSIDSTSSGHTLDFSFGIYDNFLGYMHCHVDDFISDIDYGNDGIPDTIKTIKIFSPRDIKNLLTLAYYSNSSNTTYSQLDAYGVIVSSQAEYMIKFTGNLNDITSNTTLIPLNQIEMEKFNDKFRRKVQRNNIEKTERNFLRFIKDEIGIEGIRLFRLNNDDSIDEISLNENNNRIEVPC